MIYYCTINIFIDLYSTITNYAVTTNNLQEIIIDLHATARRL